MPLCEHMNRMKSIYMKDSLLFPEKVELLKFGPETAHKPLKLNFYTLWIMDEGKGECEMNDRIYPVQNDRKVMFCNPGTIIKFHAEKQNPMHLYCIQFRILKKENTANGVIFKETRPCFLSNDVHELDSSLKIKNATSELLSRYQCESPANSFIIQKLFSEIMALVINVLMNCKGGASCSVIDCAISYLKEHYHEDITREQMACMVGLSKEYFSRLFKKETGQNFTEYLTNIRIKKVEEFLLTSNACLREIAENVGYKNEYYLSRKFKEIKGVSPTMYQKETLSSFMSQ